MGVATAIDRLEAPAGLNALPAHGGDGAPRGPALTSRAAKEDAVFAESPARAEELWLEV